VGSPAVGEMMWLDGGMLEGERGPPFIVKDEAFLLV